MEKIITFRHMKYMYFDPKNISEKDAREAFKEHLFKKGYVPLNITVEELVGTFVKLLRCYAGYAGKKPCKIHTQSSDTVKASTMSVERYSDEEVALKQKHYDAGWEDAIEKVEELIVKEILICHKEGTPTSRLTSLIMRIKELNGE